MANAIIADNRLVTASGVTFTHSTEVSGYSAENVQIYQPGESFRTSVLSPGYIDVALPSLSVANTFAAIATNATAHRNLLKQSTTLNTSPWSGTNVTVTEGVTSTSESGAGSSSEIEDDATSGEHSVEQTWTGPTSYDLEPTLVFSAFFASPGVGPLTEVRLRMEEGASYVHVIADLAVGTVGTVTTSGFTGASATIETVSARVGTETWYRVSLVATTPDATPGGVTVKLNTVVGGSVSYSGIGSGVYVEGAMLELASSAQSAPVTVTTVDTGALWAIGTAGSTLHGAKDWGHVASSDLNGTDFLNIVHKEASLIPSTGFRVNIYDPDNADGYIEIGNLVVAKGFQASENISNEWHIGWAEEGSSTRAPGGQLYRPVNKRYRRLSITHSWLTEAEAFLESFEIDRRVGRSEGVLVIPDPDSTYKHQWSIWGLQDTISDTLSRRWVQGLNARVWAKEWNIIEALP